VSRVTYLYMALSTICSPIWIESYLPLTSGNDGTRRTVSRKRPSVTDKTFDLWMIVTSWVNRKTRSMSQITQKISLVVRIEQKKHHVKGIREQDDADEIEKGDREGVVSMGVRTFLGRCKAISQAILPILVEARSVMSRVALASRPCFPISETSCLTYYSRPSVTPKPNRIQRAVVLPKSETRKRRTRHSVFSLTTTRSTSGFWDGSFETCSGGVHTNDCGIDPDLGKTHR